MKIKLTEPPRPQYPAERHHVYYGRGLRQKSEQWGAVIWLPPMMHRGNAGVHFDRDFDLSVKREFQRRFEAEGWTRSEFIEEYGRNYLD